MFTIVSRNYAAQACALMKSLERADPQAHRVIVVTDGAFPTDRARAELMDVWSIEGVAPAMALYYDALEFNTAVKPYAFKALLARPGTKTVTYLDPDILVFRPLSDVRAALDGASIALTPHMTRPLGSDGAPTDHTILQAGAYNLGFLGAAVRPDTIALMDWWADKCRFDCRVDFANGLFTDQKWMDLAPGLVDAVALLRDPGLNLAYWNLPTRRLARKGGLWTVDDRPLTFFHFSGFDPARPDQLSRYQTRLRVGAGDPLADLLELYAGALSEQDHHRASATPYGHARLQGGEPITPLMRRAALAAARRGERLDRPSAQTRDWFDTPAPDTPDLTRLAAAWLAKAGADPNTAQALDDFRRLADPDVVSGQTRLEQIGIGAARAPLRVWPFVSRPFETSSKDPLERLRGMDDDGVSRAASALWRCREDLRVRFERDDPCFLAWCLGPEALAGRFVPDLLSGEVWAALTLERDSLLDRAARFALGEDARGDVGEIRVLFGLVPRAAWPDNAQLAARRERWTARDASTGLPALLVALWMSRSDLRMQLDLRRRLDRVRLLRWFAAVGLAEYQLDPAALPRAITGSFAFRSAWRPAPVQVLGPAASELRIVDAQDERPGLAFVAPTLSFVDGGAPSPPPSRAGRVIVETSPGAAAADLIAVRARGVTFEVVEARWSAATIAALAPDDPVRAIVEIAAPG